MQILIQASQLILSLSILVILHELGHFIPAKLFKTRVEKFYLFFDPWFSLFKVKKGDTEYGVGWLPLGGYVKIAGMIDESMDKEQMKQPPQPWEFRSKPAWQRLIIMLGGVIVNAILGMLIYIMILFVWGTEYIPAENLKYGIHADSTAQQMGLQNGDKILSVGGEKIVRFRDIQKKILLESNKVVEVQRDGRTQKLEISKESVSEILGNPKSFLTPAVPAIVGEVVKGSNAEKAGLLVEDQIVSIDDIETPLFHDLVSTLKSKRGKEVTLTVVRENRELTLNAAVTEEGALGFRIQSASKQLGSKVKEYGFIESIPAGFNMAYVSFDDYIKQMKMVSDPETGAYKSVGSFLTMGKAFGPTWDWNRFWNVTAFISIILAIMNMLPIPALDGGHVMFLTYEIITGRKPHEKVMEIAQIVGIVLLLALMVFAFSNDIRNTFFQ